jgi:hypothetical protein
VIIPNRVKKQTGRIMLHYQQFPGMPDVYFVTKRNIVSNFGAVLKVVELKLEKTHDIIGFCKTKNVVCIWDSNHDYPQIHHADLTVRN